MSELPLSDQAIVGLADPLAARHPDDVALLERLVRIPSVSGPDPDSEALARSAQAVADELDAARLDWVRIVDVTCSADSSTNTTDKLRERICAPYRLDYRWNTVQLRAPSTSRMRATTSLLGSSKPDAWTWRWTS